MTLWAAAPNSACYPYVNRHSQILPLQQRDRRNNMSRAKEVIISYRHMAFDLKVDVVAENLRLNTAPPGFHLVLFTFD